MKPITLAVTVDADALLELLSLAIERGTVRCRQSIEKWAEQWAPVEKLAPIPVSAINEPQAQPNAVERATQSERLLDAKAVAKLLGVSARTVWRLSDGGRMPRPVRLGSLVRWKSDEIDDWISAGCPKVERRGMQRSRD